MQTITKQKLNKRQRYKRNRKIKRAQAMQVTHGAIHLDGRDFYYTQGEREHSITRMPDGVFMCDCKNHEAPCSHVIAVRMYRGEWNR